MSWRDGRVGARVCCSEEDLTSIAPLQACARNAEGIASPSDVVDLVGIRGVAGRVTCVDDTFGAESGVKDGGVSLNRAEVEGVGAVGIIQGMTKSQRSFCWLWRRSAVNTVS